VSVPSCNADVVEGTKNLDHELLAGSAVIAGPALIQAAAVERDQPLPVPLRGRLVVAPALREGEAVMDAGIELNLAGGACSLK